MYEKTKLTNPPTAQIRAESATPRLTFLLPHYRAASSGLSSSRGSILKAFSFRQVLVNFPGDYHEA